MKPVVLVTGGARGIGHAIASDLAFDHEVCITYHSTAPERLIAKHGGVVPIAADLSDPSNAPKLIDAVMDHFGRIDAIVNNAGAMELDAGNPDLNYAVNVATPMALFNAALPHFKRGAAVVNISSVNADFPAIGASSYSASKAALNTWTRGIAREFGPRGIRVNAVAPGAVERVEAPRPAEMVQKFTEMTSLGRIGTPDDIAPVVRFLLSDSARWITGEIITVSGGYRL